MKTITKIAALVLLALLVFLPAQPAAAKGTSFDGQVIFGQSYTLKSGDTLSGDLVVFGGAALIEEGATAQGNVILFGGSLVVNGEVLGDVAVIGGSAKIGTSAHVHGNLTTLGAALDRVDGSMVDGQIFNSATNNGSDPITSPSAPVVPHINLNLDPLRAVGNAFGQSLSLALLAMLVMLFLARNADRVAHAVLEQPLTTGGLGLLTLLVTPIALVILVITIILIPAAVVLIVAMMVAGLFGWIAIGYEIGQRFTRAIHQEWHPAFSAGLGVFALTLVANALTGIPVLNCVGWLAPFLLGVAGLGAVIMSRFGTQTVLAPAPVTPVPLDVEPKKE